MKITQLTSYPVPPRWLFLKIETDEGLVGWGEPVVEGRAATVAACVAELSDYLIGRDPSNIEDLWQVMYRGGFYRGGPILMSAIAGVDQALWDIKGKACGLPVAQMLGGQVRERIKVYSWIGGDRPAPTRPGLGVEINEDYVTERAKVGHRWRNPIWRRHPDGSLAEW